VGLYLYRPDRALALGGLKLLHPMRLEFTALPDSLNHHPGNSQLAGEHAYAPVGSIHGSGSSAWCPKSSVPTPGLVPAALASVVGEGLPGRLRLYIFCDEHLLCARQRASNRDGSAGSLKEVERMVKQIRQRSAGRYQYICFIFDFTLRASFSICSAFLMASTDTTF
jgi:hypothetical protein